MSRALVLNTTYEPLCVVSARRAVVLVLTHKADLVSESGDAMHSERLTVSIPSIIRLRTFVRVPYRATAPLTRRAVFARDQWRCQYCGSAAENLDHVIPKSKGGSHTWENVVAACRRCNSRKENRSLEDAGLRLARPPVAPSDVVISSSPVMTEVSP